MFRKNIHKRDQYKSITLQIKKEGMTLIKNLFDDDLKSSLILNLPENTSQLAELTELEITEKNLEELSELLQQLKKLKKLVIHNNILQTIPSVIGTLQNLCIINLSNNQLIQLPDEVSKLKSLEELDLSYNLLHDLPKSFLKLQRLRILNISNNKLQCIPKCIQNGIGTLRILDVSENPKIQMNVTPYSKYLEKFYASGNKNCCKFPDWLLKHKFFNLKEFDLNRTIFEVFSFIGNEGDLNYTSISMNSSNLSTPILEMIIEHMTKIEIINVGNENNSGSLNIFDRIPISKFRNPELIVELNFRATGISSISTEIKFLKNLKKLDIGLNSISWFPHEFCELTKLEFLKMDGNDFILLPENVGKLTSLRELYAKNNDISKLPKSFKDLDNLRIIDMYNNSFDEFPSAIIEMRNLIGLDFDQNFCSTENITMGQSSYSILRKSYILLIQEKLSESTDLRISGNKTRPIVESSDSDDKVYKSSYSSENEFKENVLENLPNNNSDNKDENWEVVEDSDDNFKPDDIIETPLCQQNTSKFLPPLPDVFCPADLHSKRIKVEVKSMRIHGSLPSFEIVNGQFDDA